MKLLDKKTIAQQKSLEKKQEIDEGLKLARRIDVLRDTSSKEETRLAKFRIESLKQTKKEIDELIVERERIRKEVLQAEEERRIARLPLDNEWQSLKDRRSELGSIADTILTKAQELLIEERAITDRRKYLTIDEERIADNKRESLKMILEAQENVNGSREVLEYARKAREIGDHNLSERSKILDRREAKIAVREREADITEEQFKTKDEEIIRREILVNDRYATLLRSEQRLKNGNNNSTTK